MSLTAEELEKLKKEAEIVCSNPTLIKLIADKNRVEREMADGGPKKHETIEEFAEKAKKCTEGGLSFKL